MLLTRKLTLIFLITFVVSPQSWANTKGLHRTPLSATTPQGEQLKLYEQSHALLIGVSNYTNGWTDLESISSELDAVQNTLEKQGFNVVRVNDPNAEELQNAFRRFINEYGFDSNNRLLFFFSGHGHSDDQNGYLVPIDAPVPDQDPSGFFRRALDMSQIMSWSRRIRAKHALFLFDSCFSGTVFKAKNLPKASERLIRRATEKPVRQFISAGSAGEVVPAKSTFTPAFVKAISEGEADSNGDSYITGSELGLYLSQEVPKYEDQSPQYGKIRDFRLSQGDFVFFKSRNQPAEVTRPHQISTAGAGSFELALWNDVKGSQDPAEIQIYLNSYPGGAFSELAKLRIQRLKRVDNTNIESAESDPVAANKPEIQTPAPEPKPEPVAELKPEPVEKSRLIVETRPGNARVRIMNIGPKYYPEIELDKDKAYDILVSAEGYESYRGWLKVTEKDQVLSVVLKKTIEKRLPFEPEMVAIKRGRYRMGDLSGDGNSDEKPVREVRIKPFLIGKYEVTFDEYDAYVRDTGVKRPSDKGWGRGRRPVINVSWNDAQAYINWLNKKTGKKYRLPSESEWEYVARSGSTTKYSWGDEIGRNRANCDGCGSRWDNKQTAPVGRFRSNAWGVNDMHGNVWEWVEDSYQERYKGAPRDGSARVDSGAYRVLRGGSWNLMPRNLRSALRGRLTAHYRDYDTGFRIAQDR